ncbi:response regulator transcription factor [Silicimonas algicola]|uniref:Response regulator receiver domain-containing protein n=1 Tax=Silicimonas algicola TaxID=1826607 RepID=A0A316G242_9RHOB|nr:response regulator [Silicimonas algicola]AZQ69196.1 response regulator transcription factor [Silicimonas algicola]PWK54991.1 response regulator receiver domain-containing protein [Silicimonas algicola]
MPRVMLIEDDELLRDLLQIRLEVEDYEVVTASDGLEGLSLLELERCNAVVLDLMMPVMDGLQFMRALADALADPPPVVVLSALHRPAVETDLLAAGVREILRKPVDLEMFLSKLAALTGRG